MEADELAKSGSRAAAEVLWRAVASATNAPTRAFAIAAVNLMDARIPDNDGFQPVDEPVIPNAPAAYFSTLPVKAMVEAMQRVGVPARLSDTAGTYVCNALMYAMLHQTKDVPCGFIHVPYLTGQGAGETPSLSKECVLRGITACLQTL